MALPYDPLEQISLDGTALIELVSGGDHSLTVRPCPEWNVGELGWHVARVWSFWATIVERRIATVGDLRTIEQPPPSEGDALIELMTASHAQLIAALRGAPVDAEVWTWTGANRDVTWVQRRMAQETAVHRWDVADTVGDEYVVPTAVAADGIDEFLMWFAAADRNEGEMKVGGTVHLHCTDTPAGTGEWFVAAMKEPAATFTREHRKGDAAIRGTAHDLLMWLWRRDAGPVEVIGNEIVARRFRNFTNLT